MREELYGTRLYINYSQLENNINYIKDKSKKAEIIAMVKANAYGCGDLDMSQKMEELGVNYFGVADFDEGIRLRESGIKGHIMVMNPGVHNISKILDYDLEPVIYNNTILLALINVLKEKKTHIEHTKKSIIVHVKINTGMNRWGFSISEIPKLIADIKKNKSIKVKSIYSHLASSKDSALSHILFPLESIKGSVSLSIPSE